jgi:anion-transporting  ArsA/GET3 family ATPase
MDALLERRLVVVTGKGGVGKTTVAAALGLAAARAGMRTMVCEVARQESITRAFGRSAAGASETPVAPGLATFSVDPESAKEEWLRRQLHSSTLAGLLGSSRIFQYLSAAAPGLAELVTIGKIWELAQLDRLVGGASPYDLVIVDAPATGHGLALLGAPRTYAQLTRAGPVWRHAGAIDSFITDPARTSILAVAIAEEMPVNETIDLEGRLHGQLGTLLSHVVVNGVLPERFTSAEARAIESVDGAGGPAAGEALAAALAAHARGRAQRAQVARLRRGLDAPVSTLPLLLAPEIGPEELERLSDELERRL